MLPLKQTLEINKTSGNFRGYLMTRKAKYSVEEKVKAAERYLRGEASAAEIAASLGMGKCGSRSIRDLAAIYRENGIDGFHHKKGNSRYTAREKQQAVEEYLQGKGSLYEISRKYHIPSHETLRNGLWCIIATKNFGITTRDRRYM